MRVCLCGGESRNCAGTHRRGNTEREEIRNWKVRSCGSCLGRMRVLGCGVSPPPDKRQFRSVDSVRNTVTGGKAARTFIESAAESFARVSALDQIARDDKSGRRSPAGLKTRIAPSGRRPAAGVRQRESSIRAACLAAEEESQGRLYGVVSSASEDRARSFRLCTRAN